MAFDTDKLPAPAAARPGLLRCSGCGREGEAAAEPVGSEIPRARRGLVRFVQARGRSAGTRSSAPVAGSRPGGSLALPVLVAALAFAFAGAVRAQEPPGIKWRNSYAAAREESEKKNVPLLIFVTRPACGPCARMKESTLHDARIVAALSDKVVPLMVDLSTHPELVGKLGVTLFPTTILARPNAEYETLVGYQEADVLHEKITRVLATLKPSEPASRDFENAQNWEKSGEYARAIAALRNVLDDAKAKPLQKNAEDLLRKIEMRAQERISQAKDLQAKDKLSDALDILSDVQRSFAGLRIAREAGEMADAIERAHKQLTAERRLKRVRDLTAQAEEFYKAKEYVLCLERCELINREFGDLPEARRAYALASEIRNNPQWMQAAAAVMSDRLGTMWLDLADYHMKAGEPRQAQEFLRRVVVVFPGSRFAESAQIRLNQLQAIMPAGSEIGATRP